MHGIGDDAVTRVRQWFSRLPVDWRRTGRSTFDFGKTLVIAFLLAQLVMVSVAQAFQVEQYSMEPTLLPHDRVLVNKFIYRFREPHRGDVIVLRYPRDPGKNYIKRIVGLPGDRVEIKNGHLTINGRAVEELYLNGQPSGDYGPDVIPVGSFFVLGDNRMNSEDSRAFGFLTQGQIVGQAALIYWPLNRIRILRTR